MGNLLRLSKVMQKFPGLDMGTKPPLLDEPKFVILAYVMYNMLVLLQKTDQSIITR
jgi:hypothetical protein